ncbi:hypothetical protein E5288_WYG016095 [Bos mutus]|uniref:Peptidase A1 domain-containing protein n=2 Tax=Bos mutus TaxID=72004 RepID=A0A6B0RS17_9CETA|nr:hypothetical protein [Bos mutus]
MDVFGEDGAPQRPLVLWSSTEVHLDFSAALFHFNPNASNTFHPSNQSINLIYGFVWMTGVLGYDTVWIGNLVIVNQTFGLSKVYNRPVESQPVDGVLGLGYPNLAIKGSAPILDNLKKQGVISEPLFAFYLST